MKIIAFIPARYSATRFYAKLMKKLGEQSVILTTYKNTKKTRLFDEVFVVTDSKIIYNEITQNGGKAKISIKNHKTGSDRIAEAIENMKCDIVFNVQGDEPFIEKKSLEKLIQVFETDFNVDVVTLMRKLVNPEQIEDPNYVKVVIDKNFNALYFSRSVVPYSKEYSQVNYYEHVGIYAFKRNVLLDFHKNKILQNESAEKIECLRYLEYGMKIKMIETQYMGIEINTEEDLIRANNSLKTQNKIK